MSQPIHNYRIHFGWPGHVVDVVAHSAADAKRKAMQREPDLAVRWVEYRGTRPKREVTK